MADQALKTESLAARSAARAGRNQRGARRRGSAAGHRVHDTAAQPTFEAFPAESPLGEPLTDISTGWDGSLWSITADGVPHRFSRQDHAWYVHGRGLDAIAWDANQWPLVFRGTECSYNGQEPKTIATLWPKLPRSFQLGVDGAANVDGVLYLFKAGRYVRADVSTDAVMSDDSAPLTSLTGWPKTATWQHGLVDAVGANTDNTTATITLFRDSEFVVVDMVSKAVTEGPTKLSKRYRGGLLTIMQHGIDAVAFDGTTTRVYQGPLKWATDDGGKPSATYADFRSEWNPTLAHAPSGRASALWSIDATDGTVYRHDGDDWHEMPGPNGTPTSITAGADDGVYAITNSNAVVQFDAQTGEWTQLGAPSTTSLTQISAGDNQHIYVRNDNDEIERFDATTKTLTPAAAGAKATDIAASFDGTVWHCQRDDPKAYRHLSASTVQPHAFDVAAGVTSVQKVATTGFGASHVLVQEGADTKIYQLNSPYLMKTPGNYDSAMGRQMAVGAGCLFFPYYDDDGKAANHGCVDAHTGRLRWHVPLKSTELRSMTESVFDAVFQLLYVALDDRITALDVQTGDVVWSCAQDHGAIVARPSLHGTMLCAVTDTGVVIAFDTGDAYRTAQQAQQPVDVTPLWTWTTPTPWSGTPAPQPPLIVDDGVVVSVWHREVIDSRIHIRLQVLKLALDASLLWTNMTPEGAPDDYAYFAQQMRLVPPVPFASSSIRTQQGEEVADTIIVGWNQNVYQFESANGAPFGDTYENTDDDQISSGLSVYRTTVEDLGQSYSVPICVFGTQYGVLQAVQMGPGPVSNVWNTPFPSTPPSKTGRPGTITTTPVLRPRTNAEPMIHYASVTDTHLRNFDPTNGGLTTTETGATAITTIVPTGNGVVYAGGYQTSPTTIGQYFAIRLQDALLNDFIIESQLLEDRDADAKTPLTRYQTHVTIVGDDKVAMPSQAVKVWADSPTPITVEIDGVQHAADTRNAAVFHTDATGSFTIVSDAVDTFTTPLRLWAEFMDPYERIVVYPDREFHERLTNPVADPDAGDDGDPTTVNLATTKDFANHPLCDTADQATSTANAVNHTWSAVQSQNASTLGAPHCYAGAQMSAKRRAPRPRPSRRRGPRGGRLTTAPLSKYVAYPAGGGNGSGPPPTSGMAYFAEDVLSTRPATVTTPTGFQLDDTHTFAPLTVAEATTTIDQLEGTDVTPTLLAADQTIAGFFKDLWDKVKSLANKIKKVVVSIGREIYVGLQYVEEGVNKVIRAVVRTVEDVASLVGSFFVKLGKLIKQIVEALTILFNFDKITGTADAIETFFHNLSGDVGNIASGFETAFNDSFNEFDEQIHTTFEKLIKELDPTKVGELTGGGTISSLNGMGTTAHSAFSVGANGQQQTKSHAVHCSWAAHKVRQHYKQATPSDGQGGLDATDPFANLLTGVIDGIVHDPELKKTLDGATAQFHQKIQIKSADDFFRAAAADLLEVVEVIVISAVTVVKAFVDAVAEGMPDTIAALGDLKIPVISELWNVITGKTLTFLDLIAFVLAIPITIFYRIIEGKWPPVSDSEFGLDSDIEVGLDPQAVRILSGLVTGVAMIFAGWFTAVMDALYIAKANVSKAGKILTGIVGIFLLCAQAGVNMYHSITDGSTLYFVFTFLSIVSLIIIPYSSVTGQAPELTVMNILLVAIQLATAVLAYTATPPQMSLEALISTLVAAVAVIANPLKLLPDDTLVPVIAPAADLTCRAAVGGTAIITTVRDWNEPAIAFSPTKVTVDDDLKISAGGINLQTVTDVRLGTTAATNLRYAKGSLTVTVPPMDAGSVPVSVIARKTTVTATKALKIVAGTA